MLEEPILFLAPQGLQDPRDSQALLARKVSRETKVFQEEQDFLDRLVPLVLKVLQVSLERRETQEKPSQGPV